VSAFVAEVHRGDGAPRATGIARPGQGSWIVGDIRLDDRDALCDALGAAGVPTARDAGDSDLVLAAWHAWRETSVERLRGDFSFALWDHGRRLLFCTRDQLGVRPLYWAAFGDRFICSNALDVVLAHPAATRRLNRPAIESFLQHGFNDDLATTTFADVQRLAPAHRMTFSADAGVASPRRYWSFPVPEPLRLKRDDEYLERFREVLGSAVRDRLRTDRAAILLSGGVDSTSLAATARRVAPRVALHAWTNDMAPYAPADEVSLARAVAGRLELTHDILRDKLTPLAHLESSRFRTAEPLDEPEWAAWQRNVKRIASDAPVLIIGEDGDALFRPPGLVTSARTWSAYEVLRRAIAYTLTHRRRPHLGVWLRRGFRAPRTSSHPTRPEAVGYLTAPIWQSALEQSQPAYTGVALDIVWPLLDTRVIEFVFSVPPVPWCQDKELLRRSLRGELPDAVLSRKKSPLNGFYEGQVAAWRAAHARSTPQLGEAVREFVDSRSVANTLQSGSVWDVLAAWRVLILDQWLRNL
jgi:asparagine synthase (glutamine-hydrolysing)